MPTLVTVTIKVKTFRDLNDLSVPERFCEIEELGIPPGADVVHHPANRRNLRCRYTGPAQKVRLQFRILPSDGQTERYLAAGIGFWGRPVQPGAAIIDPNGQANFKDIELDGSTVALTNVYRDHGGRAGTKAPFWEAYIFVIRESDQKFGLIDPGIENMDNQNEA